MFGNQTLLCQVVLPVRSCAAAIRPDRERAWRARPAGRLAKLLGLTVTSVQFDKLPHDIESAFQIARENRAQMVQEAWIKLYDDVQREMMRAGGISEDAGVDRL